MESRSIREARILAGVSLVLLTAVLTVGMLRSAREPTRPAATIAPAAAQDARVNIAAFASDRNTVRAAELEQLERLRSDPTASEQTRTDAARRIMQLREWMEKEAVIADVLIARGYEMPVVTVHEDSVNVVLHTSQLSRTEASVILELIMRETGVTGGNIKIIPIN
jgi:stage III sporulation protein AH